MGVVKNVSATKASQLLNSSGVDLLLSDLVNNKIGGSFFFSFFFFFSPFFQMFLFSHLTGGNFIPKLKCVQVPSSSIPWTL